MIRTIPYQASRVPNNDLLCERDFSARKEIRSQTEALRKASAAYRRHIADLKRRVQDLERKLVQYQQQLPKDEPSQVGEAEAVRFSAKGLRSNRKRLGLSAVDYGKLIGVTAQTVYSWEQGHTRPRKQQTAANAALRTMGKKEAKARLAELAGTRLRGVAGD